MLFHLPASGDEFSDIFALSLEELLEVEVTTVLKKQDTLFNTPAAVTVLTSEDIRRSGHQTLAEVLRMVPGFKVARIDSNTWAITGRGFNNRFAKNVLVMIDGRSVYTPLFGGTYWDVQDVMLEDVERIEVIKGSGGTLWGANAVVGIINVITKSAADTQGNLFTIGAGNEERGFTSYRYGGKFSEDTAYRIYVKYFDRDEAVYADGKRANDSYDAIRGGFRIDWDPSEQDHITFQGDVYDGHSAKRGFSTSPTIPFFWQDETQDVKGANLLARWTSQISETSEMSWQFYYDRTERYQTILNETRESFDLDFQHGFKLTDHQHIVLGLGYNNTSDNITNTYTVNFEPEDFSQKVISGFVQDEITLVEEQLKLIVGTKVEKNDFTDYEFLPSVRLIYTPNDKQAAWISWARAVSIPTRGFTHMTTVFASRNDQLEADDVKSFEVGYRHRPKENVFIDYALFYNVHDKFYSREKVENTPIPVWGNGLFGDSYGGEIIVYWRPSHTLNFSAGYSYIQIQMRNKYLTGEPGRALALERETPHSSLHLSAQISLGDNLELNTTLNYVDRLSGLDIPAYTRMDLGLTWHLSENAELALVGQNLLDSSHPESGSGGGVFSTEAQRSLFAKLTWRF